MRVDILRAPTSLDWKRCKELAAQTMGLKIKDEPDKKWIEKMLRSMHSPLRTIMFTIRLVDVPYFVAMHLVRHKVGVEHYVSSQRNDRQNKYDRGAAPQSSPVTYVMDVNAAELIEMAQARLCSKAYTDTRWWMNNIKTAVREVCPEVADWMHPRCYFGWCREPDGPCAMCQTFENPYAYTLGKVARIKGEANSIGD